MTPVRVLYPQACNLHIKIFTIVGETDIRKVDLAGLNPLLSNQSRVRIRVRSAGPLNPQCRMDQDSELKVANMIIAPVTPVTSNPYLCLRIDRSDTTVGERATQKKKF